MNDVAPAIYERVSKRFDYLFEKNEAIARKNAKLERKTATMTDAYEFARQVGFCVAGAFSAISEEDLPNGRMYYNIAERVIKQLLERSAAICDEYSKQVIKALNENAGLGLNPL